MRYQLSRGAPLTKGAPLLFSRTGPWFSGASKNRIANVSAPGPFLSEAWIERIPCMRR